MKSVHCSLTQSSNTHTHSPTHTCKINLLEGMGSHVVSAPVMFNEISIMATLSTLSAELKCLRGISTDGCHTFKSYVKFKSSLSLNSLGRRAPKPAALTMCSTRKTNETVTLLWLIISLSQHTPSSSLQGNYESMNKTVCFV